MKRIIFVLILFPIFVFAVDAQVTREGAQVYKLPDFDAEVLGEVEEGVKIEASKRKFGPFHRVRMKDGSLGYMSDVDFKFVSPKLGEKSGEKSGEKPTAKASASEIEKPKDPLDAKADGNLGATKEKLEKKLKSRAPHLAAQYYGPIVSYLRFREDTMGMNPTQNSYFLGAQFDGPKLLYEDAGHTEINVLLRFGAPEYYQQATGINSAGWILHLNYLWQQTSSQSKNLYTFYGFGPMFKYSKFDVGLRVSTNTVNYYSLEDMIIGGVFDAGFCYRINRMALRAEVYYYWEKMQYFGVGLAMLFPF